MLDDSLPFVGDVRLWLCMVFGMVFVLPYFIKALYYYKKTGFKFLRIYVAIAFVYYALCSFLLISSLATLAYENFNPQKLEQLKEAFSAFFQQAILRHNSHKEFKKIFLKNSKFQNLIFNSQILLFGFEFLVSFKRNLEFFEKIK